MDIEVKLQNWIFVAFLVLLMSWPVYAVVQASTASGAVDYCYVSVSIQGSFPIYYLHGHRAWRPDRFIATFRSMDEAVVSANEMKCSLEKK